MIKKLITLAAFINASIFVLPAMAIDPIHQQFQAGVQKMQAEQKFETYKRTAEAQEQALDQKKQQIHRSIQDDAVILRARLNELDYLSDFLKVDNAAKQSVEASLEAAHGPNHTNETVTTAAVVALISGGAYALATSKVPEAGSETAQQKAAKTRAKNSSNFFTKQIENIRGNTVAKNVSAAVFVVSVLAGAGALVENYYSTAPQKEAAVNQERIYLSRLASDNQNDFLTISQINQTLSTRAKDAAFGAKVSSELDAILKDANERTSSITQKRSDILQINNQISVLDDQVAAQRSLIQQQAKVTR